MHEGPNGDDQGRRDATQAVLQMRNTLAHELLRYALAMLKQFGDNLRLRPAFTYQALMCATDLGYRCGIQGVPIYASAKSFLVFIELPTGLITLPLDTMWQAYEYPMRGDIEGRIDAFLTRP